MGLGMVEWEVADGLNVGGGDGGADMAFHLLYCF